MSLSEPSPITISSTSTIVEPKKKRGRSKKNGTDSSESTTTTTNTTTITITPKFIDMDSLEEGSDIVSSLTSSKNNKVKNEIISLSENNTKENNNDIHKENITSDFSNETNITNDYEPNVININIEIDTSDKPHTPKLNVDEDDGLYNLIEFKYDLLIPFILINMHASSRESILALLHTTLVNCIEGRCISEGFIKPNTVRIVDFKCGKIVAKNVQFNLVIECQACNPNENSIIICIAKNITQAGIRAISSDEHLPVVVYISRDYSILTQNNYYNTIKEGDKIHVKVIGKRFEMNDKFIQIIGDLVSPKKERLSVKNSKKLFTIPSTLNSSSNIESASEILSNTTMSFTSSSASSSSSSTACSTTSSTTAHEAISTTTATSKSKVTKTNKESKSSKETKPSKEPKQKIKSNITTVNKNAD